MLKKLKSNQSKIIIWLDFIFQKKKMFELQNKTNIIYKYNYGI